MDLPSEILTNPADGFWDTGAVHERLQAAGSSQAQRSTERALEKSGLLPAVLKGPDLLDELGRPAVRTVFDNFEAQAKRKRTHALYVQLHRPAAAPPMLFANDGRGARRWIYLDAGEPTASAVESGLVRLAGGKPLLVWPHGELVALCRELVARQGTHQYAAQSINLILACFIYHEAEIARAPTGPRLVPGVGTDATVSHLDRLEAESIHIMREVAAQAENPVMLYSVGKDSSVMLHLAKKAFYPSPPPFPLMHIDTRCRDRRGLCSSPRPRD